ncbi:MAG: DUF72 domain-containing protein [Candidatus Bathyarchaeota archaeon]|nr:DUF72 domain-containing protein [Candidatus Bathyarchaeum tardum]WGM88898.1 MAG: DUF72 domain-containing protein [Candidatus Bathyarchaeum tardum]
MNKKIHIGTMGWSYDFWKNQLYSSSAKPENFLQEYCQHFNTVEVNSTFYRIPTIETIKKWMKQTKPDFIFSIKAPKKISHQKLAKDNPDYLDFFLSTISNFGTKLGPVLFQFPPSFTSANFGALTDFTSVLSKRFRYAFEIRNKSWYNEKFYSLLEQNKIALVLGDSPWINKLNMVTTDFTYFRWEGNRMQIKGTLGKVEKERTEDTQKWGKKIQQLSNKTVIFGYFSKYYSGYPPTDAKQLLNYLLAEK